MKSRSLFLIALAISCLGCAAASKSDDAPQVSDAVAMTARGETSTSMVRAGRDIYMTSCAECHGNNGEGAEKGISLIKGHALYHTADDFIERVTDGKTDVMPAFRDKLSEAEIAEVVRFVREDIQGPYLKNKSNKSKESK